MEGNVPSVSVAQNAGTGKAGARTARRGSVSNAASGGEQFASRGTEPETVTGTRSTDAPASQPPANRRPSVSTKTSRVTTSGSVVAPGPTNVANKNVHLFGHLPHFDRSAVLLNPAASITSHLLKTSKEAVIHPAIIKLALAFADYSIMGASERCRQMLLAFKQVRLSALSLQVVMCVFAFVFVFELSRVACRVSCVMCSFSCSCSRSHAKQVFRDYQAPADQAISRHLEAHLRPLIAFLVQARPLAISMGHAIRHLKLKISTLPPDTTESEARQFMAAVVDNYLRNRIDLSDQLIAQHGGTKIQDGDVILAFAHSNVVATTLIRAHQHAGRRFRVVVVDSRPFLEGRRTLERLVDAGLDCTYLHLNAVAHVMKEVTKVFLGAHALFSNGALLSRVGTATIALIAKNANKPVIVCCETLKFSDHLQLDSIVFNEIGDADALVASAVRHSTGGHNQTLVNWRTLPNLKLLNVLYDVTPPEFISLVISEVGLIPVTSIPVVLREYNSAGNNSASQ